MTTRIAPLRGTTSLYCYIAGQRVMIWRENYKYHTVNQDVFRQLYHELDDYRAVLKEDCIEYAVYQPGEPLSSYPDWFISAYDNGYIFEDDYGSFIFYDEYNSLAMSPGSIVLRNFKGDLRYMEEEDFSKYYEIIGGVKYER